MGKKRQSEGRLWRAVREAERAAIVEAMELHLNHLPAAAEYLGIEVSTLHKKIAALGLEKELPVKRIFSRARDSWDPEVREAARQALSEKRSSKSARPSRRSPRTDSQTPRAPSGAVPSWMVRPSTETDPASVVWEWAKRWRSGS